MIGSITLTTRRTESVGQAIASTRATASVAAAEPSKATMTRISSCLQVVDTPRVRAEGEPTAPPTIGLAGAGSCDADEGSIDGSFARTGEMS